MIKTKRKALELFIRAQMEGPGACNGSFYFDGDPDTQHGTDEVINTTPGSLYTTGILFPHREETLAQTNVQEEKAKLQQNEDLEPSPQSETTEDDTPNEELFEEASSQDVEEGDLYSISQRYPNTIGLSCCLDIKDAYDWGSGIIVTLSGRYYTPIPTSQCTSIVVKIEDVNDFQAIYNKYITRLSSYFTLRDDGITPAKDLSNEIKEVKDIILTINKELCLEIANTGGSLDPEYNSIGENFRYLKSYKERLWRKLKYFRDTYISDGERLSIETRLSNIERYETFLSYLEDAINICESKSFGYWRSHSFNVPINLGFIDFHKVGNKAIYSPHKYEELNVPIYKDETRKLALSLSLWIQITKSKKNPEKRYLKIQVENTSTPFKEDGKHYFSIVTEKVNERSFFGINLKVESPFLVPYQESDSNQLQDDVEELNYLYKSLKDYAVGHACSVDWGVTEGRHWVKTEFIPSYETPDVEAVPRDKYNYEEIDGHYLPKQLLSSSKALEFKWLSTFSNASNADIIAQLKQFVEAYQNWIKTQENILKQSSDDHKIGFENLQKCQEDCDRMRSNISLILEGDETIMEAFRLMNSAMFIQLWHSKRSTNAATSFKFYSSDEADDHLYGDFPATWRPFQLAFILLNLDGIVQRPDDPKWEYRNELVDLVWFPTGGGKTEAYLGIIALAIIVRRYTNEQNYGGTTAIMRYTLRLLATQQFQRAMRVIVALEEIRRWGMYHLGDEPITIGLYVGGSSLPNTAKDLEKECIKWSTFDAAGSRRESQIPLDKCPHCGNLLEYQNTGNSTAPQITFRCTDIDCAFSDSLPVVLCDEDIYRTPPTLLFGTVDKFAALGHKVNTNDENKDSRRLFGKGDLGNLPPSLIIQDELHLLLGPLGSAVSLFECAIEQLCTYMSDTGIPIKPKVISSTATTRNTELQIRALYDKDVSIFPKPGVDYDDSFFSFYMREKVDGAVKYISKRKYIGIMPTGRTHMTAQMRLVAAIFVHRALFEKEYATSLNNRDVEEAMDFYHSVLDYFNSLKEVGKTDAQFFTEYTKYTRRLLKRVLRHSNTLECLYGYDSSFSKAELTGRLSGSEVVKELEKVSSRWKASNRLPHIDETGSLVPGATPPDLILATNMISVGLDVDRFNTIIMNSMPRNIAEYIQASSRVARNKAGLVITLHNPFRARDVSHFERFREFHEKLYYFVEPISITPFSKKSIDKYMPLYIATMMRHSFPGLANSDRAGSLTSVLRDQLKNLLSDYFEQRLIRTQRPKVKDKELLTQELKDYIDLFIDRALQYWQEAVDEQDTDNYSLRYTDSELINNLPANRRNGNTFKDLFLAVDAYQDVDTTNLWLVPTSLRTIESEAVINVKDN